MSWGDTLKKVALGEEVTAGEAEQLRLIGNALENLVGLASKVDPITGNVSDLVAGDTELSRAGIYFGSRTGVLDENGVVLIGDRLKWRNTLTGTTRAYMQGTIDEATAAELHIVVDGDTAWDNLLRLRCLGTTTDGSQIRLHSDSSQVASIDFMCMTGGAQNYVLYLYADHAKFEDVIKIKERSVSIDDTAGYGQLWIKDDAPCVLRFTDDLGSEYTVDMTVLPIGTAHLSASGTIAVAGYRSRAGKSALSASATAAIAGEVV